MEDSPLSITASVTGILTFVAAIIAFIYVRYNTLRNGRAEMVSVLESVTATIAETREVATATPAPAAESESDSAAGQLAKLVGDLYRIELAILAQYMKVYGTNVASMQSNLRPDDGTSSAATWQDALQVVATSYARKPATIPSYFSRVTQALQASIPNGEAAAQVTTGVMGVLTMSMQFVAYSGAYPTMIRWYMVRDEVLEKVKEREAVRSRLMFHQVFAANVLSQRLQNETAALQNETQVLQGETQVIKYQTEVIRDEARAIKEELRNLGAQVHWLSDNMKRFCHETFEQIKSLKAPRPEAADSVGTHKSAEDAKVV